MNILRSAVSASEGCVRIVALRMEKMKILKIRYTFSNPYDSIQMIALSDDVNNPKI